MSKERRRHHGSARLYRDTIRRTKTIASVTDTTIADLIDRILVPELDRLEKKHLAKFASPERPARTRPAE
jgi:hypothetical protein